MFLEYPPDFNGWRDTEKMIVKHLELMDKQLVQVRAGVPGAQTCLGCRSSAWGTSMDRQLVRGGARPVALVRTAQVSVGYR